MAFTVGWPEGNSAVSVATADSYFLDRATSAWAGDDTVKQGALVRATDYVRAMFAARFDPALFTVALPGLPPPFENAICEYALIELKTPGGLAPPPQVDASGYAVVTTMKKVGPIQRQFAAVPTPTGRAPGRRTFPIADAFIASLLLATAGLNRAIR